MAASRDSGSAHVSGIIHTYIVYFRYNKPGKLLPKSAGGQMKTGEKTDENCLEPEKSTNKLQGAGW